MARPAAPCPLCQRPVAPRASNPDYPFCSRRCRLLDLGQWLGEGYRVPVIEEEVGEGEAEGRSAQRGEWPQ